MSRITTNMGLTAPASQDDVYDYNTNAQNLYLTDYHDHSPGRGARLTGASIVQGSLNGLNLSTNAGITNSQLATYGLPNGIATLNSSGKVPTSQIEPLVPTISSSTTINALNGQQIIVTSNASTNVNLPTHAAGQLIGITNYNISGVASSPITTVSGTNIYGIGLSQSGASYFYLGGYGASVILLDDGTAWRIISGQQDTGWLPLDAYSPLQAFNASARMIGDRVFLTGRLYNNGTMAYQAEVGMAGLPSAVVRPLDTNTLFPTLGTASPAFTSFSSQQVYIQGGVLYSPESLPSQWSVYFDSVSYDAS